MNFKFAKTLLMGSVLTMGAFGLIACGDDSSSGPSGQPGGGDQIVIPGKQDAQISITGFQATQADPYVKFQGSASLAFTDTTIQASENLIFTGINFQVGFVNGTALEGTNVAPIITKPVTFPTNRVLNILEMGTTIDLKDPNFTKCGAYNLVVVVTASDGTNEFTASAQAAFNRNDSFCAAEPTPGPSTPDKQEISMEAIVVDQLSTTIPTGISFATGAAADAATADVVFTKTSKDDITISSATGYKFAMVENDEIWASEGAWPEQYFPRDAYLSDFKFRDITLKPTVADVIANYDQQIFVATAPSYDKNTGAGLYAFAIFDHSLGNNGDRNFSVKFYKVK